MRPKRLPPLLVPLSILLVSGLSLAEPGPNTWVRVAGGAGGGRRCGAVLVPIDGARRMLLLGGEPGKGAYVRAWDVRRKAWSDFSAESPAKRGIHPAYQAAYDPGAKKLYCLTYPGRLYTFDVAAKTWAGAAAGDALAGLSWHAMAIDPAGRKCVVVGADKRAGNLGWSRTAVLDLDAGTWTPLAVPVGKTAAEHTRLVAAGEALGELVGRIRMAWYRDPAGAGTAAQRKALVARCSAIAKLPALSRHAESVANVSSLSAGGKLLDALRAARSLHRGLDELAQRQWPVPPARRNAPLVFDARNKVFVLFGGDHEDYLTNDTWVLDLARGTWRRKAPALAPSPRAGHAMVYVPALGRVLLYGGYVPNSSADYGVGTWRPLRPRQLWAYDVAGDRWDLLDAFQQGKGKGKSEGEASVPPAACEFYGYHGQYYNAPALAGDADGRLALVVPAGRGGKYRGSTWLLRPDLAGADPVRREKLAAKPDTRLTRTGRFLARYCEVPDRPRDPQLASLPANRWVQLPAVRRNVAYGCRQRDWGTAVWDAANDQILLWGGGHCVGSASTVIHYSPASNRMVEGFDADEPYGRNGNGGYDSSLLGRPWNGVHSYNTYAYDPPSGRMISARGYTYDPLRMDWLRRERAATPFRYIWGATVLEATGHGAVAWATDAKKDRQGLWVHDKDAGWVDLKPTGTLYKPYCDSEGMVYDTKRDRLVLGFGGGYAKAGDGSLATFDFKTRAVGRLTPARAELGRIRNTREMAYVDTCDWIAFAEPYYTGDRKKAPHYLRVYDCAANRYFLLDAGPGPSRRHKVHGQGWCWDARRKVLFVITIRGEVHALRFDPASAKRLDAPPGPKATDPMERLGQTINRS